MQDFLRKKLHQKWRKWPKIYFFKIIEKLGPYFFSVSQLRFIANANRAGGVWESPLQKFLGSKMPQGNPVFSLQIAAT